METIEVSWLASNTEVLDLVDSLTMKKVNFDDLNRHEAADVLYSLRDGVNQILLEIKQVQNIWNREGAARAIYMIENGYFNFTLYLGGSGGLDFGQYKIKMIK
nr:MAG TPA: hypothetical protein [Caudoviricetes sp.]